MKVLETETAQSLFDSFIKMKMKLIADKKIMDKKDKHNYPIKNTAFSIPDDWVWCFLSDVSIIQEGPGIRKHQYENEGVQFLTVTNILEGSVDLNKSKKYISNSEYSNKYEHFTINKGDIVTACSGGSWGKSSLYNLDDKIILNTSTLRLRFFNDLGENKYLYYLTKTSYFKGNLSSHSTGQQANYGYSHYSKIPIPLPPLNKQKEIVDILDKAFTALDIAKANVEENLQNTKDFFVSYLQNVFTNKKGDWNSKKLGDFCEFKNGRAFKKTEWVEEGLPIIRIANLNNKNASFNHYNGDYDKKILIKKGDLLFSWSGTIGSSFGPHVWNSEDGLLNQHIYKVGYPKDFDSNFIYYLFLEITSELEKLTNGAVGLVHVKKSTLNDYKVQIPPLSQQIEIAKKLDELSMECKKLEAIYTQKLADLEEMKKSLFQKAFSGQLNTINPSYE